MARTKLQQLVFRLATQTDAGRIQWEATDLDGVYQASFSSSAVHILELPNSDHPDEMDIVLRIYNEAGRLVEEIRDPDIAGGDVTASAAYSTMKDMFGAARRYAMGVEQVIDKLNSELEENELPF